MQTQEEEKLMQGAHNIENKDDFWISLSQEIHQKRADDSVDTEEEEDPHGFVMVTKGNPDLSKSQKVSNKKKKAFVIEGEEDSDEADGVGELPNMRHQASTP
jgi:hypothetical protein